MQKKYFFALFILPLLMHWACNNTPQTAGNLPTATRGGDIVPVDFPKLDIPGFEFPRDSNTINGWIHRNDSLSQYKHAWGLWTGTTKLTDQKGSFGDALRVFETWLTPEEIVDAMKKNNQDLVAKGSDIRSNRANLQTPRQFGHEGLGGSPIAVDDVFEAHSYSPGAADYALKNKVFSAVQRAKYAAAGNNIPPFPDDAITTKPTYKILRVSSGDSIFSIPVWPPDPSSGYPKPQGYPESKWNNSIQINVNAKQSDPSKRLYALSDFIYYKMNEEDAKAFNDKVEATDAKAGDIAILVGMHITSREITNWTWQTFWWVPDADNPAFPSSKTIADARPAQLTGAARHYAMSITYYMVNPNEPAATLEKVIGKPNYGFNPYMEAKFDNKFNPELSKVYTDDKTFVSTNTGIQSNCMSCHRAAGVSKTSLTYTPPLIFAGDAYVSEKDPIFKDYLFTDFAWSVALTPMDTTGLASYLAQNSKK